MSGTTVTEVTEAESRQRLRNMTQANGLSYPWLERMAQVEGHQWVGDWLEAHRFGHVAEEWRSAVWLHRWEPLTRPEVQP